MNKDINSVKNVIFSSENESKNRESFQNLFKECPIPDNQLLRNLGLFINRQNLSRILFMNEMYQRILDTHGVIIEFGVNWGQNLALFESMRGIYEPYNYNRKIVGFDTFEGFPSIDEKDGKSDLAQVGELSTTKGYEVYLSKVLDYHETESPLMHMKKYELVKGDATITIDDYLNNHPETIIAFAYFDFDIYKPTKVCLEKIAKHLTKGSIIGFDELNCPGWPGETIAVREVLGLEKYKIIHSKYSPTGSYIVIE